MTAPSKRIVWLDVVKGIAILWIVFFHLYRPYTNERLPWPLASHYFTRFLEQCQPSAAAEHFTCLAAALYNAVVQLGFHAVAVFVLLSGFALARGLGEQPMGGWRGWGSWYRKRLLRLYPMYWVAHLVVLLSPFVARPEPLDARIFWSLLGNRSYPVETLFYYLNPAWWYFGLLLQLYLVFPLLFWGLRRLGPLRFLMLSIVLTVAARHWLLNVSPVNGNYVQGAFFLPRLWEFTAGMALGWVHRRDPSGVEARLFSWGGLLAGITLYGVGLLSYRSATAYLLTDGLTGMGLFMLLAWAARLVSRLPSVGSTLAYVGAFSYGLFLLHQPYVIYAGERMRELALPTFIVLSLPLLTILILGSSALERLVNRWTAPRAL